MHCHPPGTAGRPDRSFYSVVSLRSVPATTPWDDRAAAAASTCQPLVAVWLPRQTATPSRTASPLRTERLLTEVVASGM
jgi:hypothetical protein